MFFSFHHSHFSKDHIVLINDVCPPKFFVRKRLCLTRLKPDFQWRISISIGINTSTCVSKSEHRRHKHKHRKNGHARSSCAYAYAVAVTSENGVGISTRYRLRHRVEENWYRELGQICHSARAYDLMLNMLVLIAYALVKTRLIQGVRTNQTNDSWIRLICYCETNKQSPVLRSEQLEVT